MEAYKLQLIETLVVAILWLLTRYFFKRAIKRIAIKFNVAIERRRIVVRLTNFITFILGVISLTLIWGVDQNNCWFSSRPP
ncbi:MAG: hypothetical protein E6Q37_10095 [Crocinitomicaceae bacterium]|nr:MAG: hypothetical protein E6Q37_10095 [Crocinitomicaceae bacterium]